jgi:hypothetical protein
VQRKKTFLVVCLSIVMGTLSAQTSPPAGVDKFIPDRLPFKRTFATAPKGNLPPFRFMGKSRLPGFQITTPDNRVPDITTPYNRASDMITPYTLGFFCKEELVIQKTLRLPLFLRLGSLDYCNKLEGK